VFAVWKTNQPFDAKHFPWEPTRDSPPATPTPAPADAAVAAGNDKAVGHKQDAPAQTVVSTASDKVEEAATAVNPPPSVPPRPQVDFAFLRKQITMEQVLRHLGVMEGLRGR